MTSKKKVVIGAASQEKKNLLYLKELIEAGKIQSVIDRTLPVGTNCRGAQVCRHRNQKREYSYYCGVE